MKPPNLSQMKVLDALHLKRKRGLSLTQLEQRTGLSRDGIRDYLSELRTYYRLNIVGVNGKYRVNK